MKGLTTLMMAMLLLSVFAASLAIKPASAQTGLVGYWKFDEGSGNTAHDSSGNGNTGTLTNGPVWVDGKYGKALKFDGVDDYVSIPHSSSLDISGNQMTVDYWMKLTVDWHPGMSPAVMCIYDKGDAYVGSMIAETGAHRFNLAYVFPYPETNKNSWTADTWYYIADVYNGTHINLYVNGVLDKAEPVTGSIPHSTINLVIGAQSLQAWPWYFNGTLDGIRIYNKALSQQEVLRDMNPDVGGVVVSVDKLSLLAPYIGLVLTVSAATIATVTYAKRKKNNSE